MICNTGVGLTPIVDGQVLTFQEQGLYDGLFLLGDVETGTRWNHLTGEALVGEHVGKTLPTEPIVHTTVQQVLAESPEALLAVSEHPQALGGLERGGTLSRLLDQIRDVPPMFPATLGTEDERRPRMDIGIGIWDDARRARYYSMADVDAAGGAVRDAFSGRSVVVYYDPTAHSLQALYADAEGLRWDGDVLHLGDGTRIEQGVLTDASGARVTPDRPHQVFTRWYGFSLTFPDTDVFESP